MSSETQNAIQKPPYDIRFEVAAAEMLEKSLVASDEDLLVRPMGIFRRDYSRDVTTLSNHTSYRNRVCFDLSRKGLYDTLPEFIFHRQEKEIKAKDGEGMADDVRRRRREEQEARRFFLPLEQEFYRARLLGEREERKSLLSGDDAHLNPKLTSFWGLDDCFDSSQKAQLILLLPLAHRIANDFPLTAACLGLVLREQVEIHFAPPAQVEVPEALQPELGAQYLGLDWTLGASFRSATLGLEVRIGPVTAGRLSSFLPDGADHRSLLRLFDYFLPAEADVITTVLLRPEDEGFVLSGTGLSEMLGYSTVL